MIYFKLDLKMNKLFVEPCGMNTEYLAVIVGRNR